MKLGTCRVVPAFVANHFDVFFLLPEPKRVPENVIRYVTRIKTRVLEYEF